MSDDNLESSHARRGRPVDPALSEKIVDAACDLFSQLGFQATTMDKVASRAKISKLSIYKHFESKEALFSAAIASRCQAFAPNSLFEGMEGTPEEQLLAVGNSLLRLLLSPAVRDVRDMIKSDKVNQAQLTRLFYEAGPVRFLGQIEKLLRRMHNGNALSVPDPAQSARLFGALFQGADLLLIVDFDPDKVESDATISSYCHSAVAMFMAGHLPD